MRKIVLSFLFLIVVNGCGSCGDGNVTETNSGRLLVSPDPIAFSTIDIGEIGEQIIVISNVADSDPLSIFSVDLEPQENGNTNGLELIDSATYPQKLEENGEYEILLKYTPKVNVGTPKAQLSIRSSDDRFKTKIILINVLGNKPQLFVDPVAIRFPRQKVGSRQTQPLKIRNIGSAPLKIWEAPKYAGGEDFRIKFAGDAYPLTLKKGDPDLVIDVEYAPFGNNADTGKIHIISNDPSGEDSAGEGADLKKTTTVDVLANATAPCILVDGLRRNFGQVPIGSTVPDIVSITNCGNEVLELTSIQLDKNSPDDEFEINLQDWDQNNDGQIDGNIQIAPGARESFFIRYTPLQVGTDKGRITIASNDPLQNQLHLDLIARGSEGICPNAKAGAYIRGVSVTPRANISAAPLKHIVLDGSASSDEDGRVVEYLWDVISEPVGSAVALGPARGDVNDTDFSKREFRLLLAGEYIFELRVKDNEGFISCGDPARIVVRAVPNEKILIELTWTNPEDPDETDDAGSDVDLHLTKMGPGNWFEAPYDIYFRNPNSGAGNETNGFWNPESPSLDVDDRNGGGPETIQMNDPSTCEWYAVGVHYYRQLFGVAYATLRIYINAQLVFEDFSPLAKGGQFWDVARIHWDSGQVYATHSPVFNALPAKLPPEVGTSMKSSGLCTQQALYPIQ